MLSTLWIRLMRVGVSLAFTTAAVGITVAAAKPPEGVRRPRALNLFANAGLLFQVNRQQCGLDNRGQVCVQFAGSPVGGGGFWPKGTPDQYIFNSGLQLAGVIPTNAGFTWAGDTVGAYFFDARGTQLQGAGLTGVFNRLDPGDAANWPNGAIVRDPAIYNPVLLGRAAISQGDAWVRYWEGDPAFLSGRTHPMGVLVDERVLAWNFPTGNEDIIYVIYNFYNVTARSTSGKYTNPTIPAPLQAEIAAFGDQFQDINEAKFKVAIPDTGYTIGSLFAAFAMDADVAVFSQNYATAILPFNIGMEYTGQWLPEVGWTFPPDIFGPPFVAAPGFIGVKYLRSPTDASGKQVGLTLFSQNVNSATGFPDPIGVNQLYRYLSGFLGPTDNPCNPFTNPAVARQRKLCFLGQSQGDARFYQASGPFALPPGESRSIVVAYINAAPLGVPGFVVGVDTKPKIPFTGDSIFADTTKIRLIERIAGWVTQSDKNGDQIIEQDEVVTAPRSLLNKALRAQDVFNKGFLLPSSPEAPPFYLVPGNNQVTVVWGKSQTETAGDPFYAIASDTSLSLFDANFRQFDVEGYRIYRGRTSSGLTLLKQFDYDNTTFSDHLGAIDYGDVNGDGKVQCAPELGLQQDCPITFDTNKPFAAHNDVDLVGDIIQVVVPGGRTLLGTGGTINLEGKADTAVITTLCGTEKCPALVNNGVPFAFVDKDVVNSFTYFYTVTAFDVNSVQSGPTSLESPRVTKKVTPRKAAANEAEATLVSGFFGDDTVKLDPTRLWSIDANTGRFQGSPPPTDGLAAAFAPLVPQLLPAVSLTATIDSLRPHDELDFNCGAATNSQGTCYEVFLTFDKSGAKTRFQVLADWPNWVNFDNISEATVAAGALQITADSGSAARFGIPNGFAKSTASLTATLRQYIDFSASEGAAARRNLFGLGVGISPGGSRWFDGADETVDHPTYSIRVGRVAGADTIWVPLGHTDTDPGTAGSQRYSTSTQLQCFYRLLGGLARQADVQFTWGASGTITTVRDLTHHVNVLFKPVPEASYGFIGDANADGKIDWDDFNYIETASQGAEDFGFCNHTDPGAGARAALVQQPVIMAVSTAAAPQVNPTQTGTGFGLYVNGERYIFQLTGGNPPAAGTKWTLRTYAGYVKASSNAETRTPGGYSFSPKTRPPFIPGLRVTFNVAQPTRTLAVEPDTVLAHVHTVPDPYYVANALEVTTNQKILKFVNLPSQAIIRIYSVSGILVNVIIHDDPGLGGEETWNLRNRNNQFVASGVYFYHIETPSGHTKVGRFTIVNFAP